MKLCTTCGRRWDVAGPRCPDDGTPLVRSETGGGDPDGSAGGAGGGDPDGSAGGAGGRAPRGIVVAEAASAGRASASATWSAAQPALAPPRPAARDELAPGTCVGEYVIERRIGVGGMGVVYGARHPVIGKRAAIKILNAKLTADEEALSRFVLEAQAVNRIGHANIVDIFSFGTLDDGRSYFAMEWLQGETLGARLERGRLTVREAIAILSPLCRALEAAHAAGVIHRDLKPDNVFLATDDDGWRVKLLDFGIAKLSTATAQVSRTATGVAMGTPLYMAPEQARGEAVDGRTDVYALGLVAYTMLCGVQLFEDEGSAIEILAAHITRPPVPPRERVPDLPAALDALILEMIAKQPDQRPALGEIRRRLAAIADATDRPAPPAMPGAVNRPAPPGRAGEPTLAANIAGAPASRPPTMPGEPSADAGEPPAAHRSPLPSADAGEPPAAHRSPLPSADEPPHAPAMQDAEPVTGGAAQDPSTMLGSGPVASGAAQDPSTTLGSGPVASGAAQDPSTMLGSGPVASGAAQDPSTTLGSGPVAGAHGSEIAVAHRRRWWPLGLAAVVAIAAAGAVIVLRGSSAPVAAGPRDTGAAQAPGAAARPAVPGGLDMGTSAAPSPPAATDPSAPPAQAPAAPPSSRAPSAAPITAELVVEPRGAQLSVDGQPIPLVAGRAALALPPGDHEALASAAGRVARQRFTVTAGRAARVALRVPAAPATAAPRAASRGGDDVDGVEDPFRK